MGVMRLKFSTEAPMYIKKNPRLYPNGPPVYHYEPASPDWITENPKAMDPIELSNVYINESTVPNAGEGVFARRDIPAYSLVAMYAGQLLEDSNSMYTPNMTIDERENRHKYLLTFNDTYDLDIPPEFEDIQVYRASLGHKINHSFKGNTRFCHVKSPRYCKDLH